MLGAYDWDAVTVSGMLSAFFLCFALARLIMAFIAKPYPTGSDAAITFTVTMMGLGSVIGNYLIGGIIDWTKNRAGEESSEGLVRGLQAWYGLIGLCAALCAISGIILYVYLRKRREVI